MRKEQFLKIGLTNEQTEKVMELNKEEQRNFIPKTRFDKLNEKKKELEKQVMILQAKIEEMLFTNEANRTLKEQAGVLWENFISSTFKQEELLREFLIQAAIRAKLQGVAHTEFIIDRIDKSKLTLTSQGEVLGLDKQLIKMQTEYPDYFEIFSLEG